MDPDQVPSLGETIELAGELGRGAFGVVLAGRLRSDGTAVAVKLPLEGAPLAEPERVLREARLLAAISHPALVRLIGCFRHEDGRLAIVYEKVEGQDLEKVLVGSPPLDPGVRLGWIADLAGGLEALHARGLLHRDLKAENAMLEPGGRVKMIDFGLLRPEGTGQTVTATGVILGTPSYLDPAVLFGARQNKASDLYALAVLAFRVLAGQLPFPHRESDPLASMGDERLPRIGGPGTGLPAGLDRVFAKALSRRPEQRYQGPGELVAALEAELAPGREGSSATILVAGRTGERARPGPGLAAGEASPIPGGAGPGVRALVFAGVAALGLGLAVGRRGGRSEGAGSGDPARPSGPRPVAPGALVEVRDRLERGASRDPWAYRALVERVGPVQRAHRWIAAGGRREELTAAELEELKGIDQAFDEARLTRPFDFFLRAAPAAKGQALPEFWIAAAREEGLDLARLQTPWLVAALAHWLEAWQGIQTATEAVKLHAEGKKPLPFLIPPFILKMSPSVGTVVDAASVTGDARSALVPWLREATQGSAAFLYSMSRALDEVAGEDREELACWAVRRAHLLSDAASTAPFELPSEVLAGGPCISAPAASFRGTWLSLALDIRGRMARSPVELAEECTGLLRRAVDEPGPGKGGAERQGVTALLLLTVLLRLDRPDEASELATRTRTMVDGLAAVRRREALFELRHVFAARRAAYLPKAWLEREIAFLREEQAKDPGRGSGYEKTLIKLEEVAKLGR